LVAPAIAHQVLAVYQAFEDSCDAFLFTYLLKKGLSNAF
jgi:hypothetical protein